MKRMTKLLPIWPVLIAASLMCQEAQAAPPQTKTKQPAKPAAKLITAAAPTTTVVDEPIGARSSLGVTLWHMGHNVEMIHKFHDFLTQRALKPDQFLTARQVPPKDTSRILLEPKRLAPDRACGWKAQGEYLTSAPQDAGPTVSFPLRVDRTGLYRLWIRYYGWPTGTGVTSLKIYRAGRDNEGPVWDDEIFDYAVEKEGPTWKDVVLDLGAGEYVVRLGHITRWWHAGAGPKSYLERRIDCLYFTDELWSEAPAETDLKTLRDMIPVGEIQTIAHPALSREEYSVWQWWQIRPVPWERAAAQPQLFALSREFWRREINRLAAQDYKDKLPDYRAPVRQIIFDDTWNLVGNPVEIRRHIEALRSDVSALPSPHHNYWLQAGDFKKLEGQWERSGTSLRANYGDFAGAASTDLPIENKGKYSVWVRPGNAEGYFAPWRLKVSIAPDNALAFDYDQQNYAEDWIKAGEIEVLKPGKVQFEVTPLGYKAPATYRVIHDFFLTTDPQYVPKGSVRPPLTKGRYAARARAAGAGEKDRYLLWVFENAYTPLLQEVWNDQAWPRRGQAVLPAKEIALARDSRRAVQIGLRNLGDKPITLRVAGGLLRGAAGEFKNKISWRVIGFAPYGQGRQDWSPFVLLRRREVTIPPLNVAGVWLTIDSTGVPPGRYTAQVPFSGENLPSRNVALQVQVAPVQIAPRQPILVGGYTNPPEGEVYARDYSEHGMNIWYSDISKAEMQKRGIRLLTLPMWAATEDQVRARIARLKALGLEYSDWVFTILDEPSGDTEEKLKPFLDVARTIRAVDPQVRISFNPSEAAKLETFEMLDPWADFWLPYSLHLSHPPQTAAAKQAIYTTKPWMWYTTPCYWDKAPDYPANIYAQIRSVPAQLGDVRGTAFFAFYYPFRDPWDTAHEHLPDVSVHVLPSRHGPIATRAWEAIEEAIQDANLAQMVKEKSGAQRDDPAIKKLISEGDIASLAAWLAKK
ncbi:MAG: hypothetical protein ACR2HJ_06205 [Fimbriimonadales bacterium]